MLPGHLMSFFGDGASGTRPRELAIPRISLFGEGMSVSVSQGASYQPLSTKVSSEEIEVKKKGSLETGEDIVVDIYRQCRCR